MKAKVGDIIKVQGAVVEIKEIIYQDHDAQDGWDIELRDTHNLYLHWKQVYDGGELYRK